METEREYLFVFEGLGGVDKSTIGKDVFSNLAGKCLPVKELGKMDRKEDPALASFLSSTVYT